MAFRVFATLAVLLFHVCSAFGGGVSTLNILKGQEVLFEDDFDDNRNHWHIASDANRSYEIKESAYRFRHKSKKPYWNMFLQEGFHLDGSRPFTYSARVTLSHVGWGADARAGILWGREDVASQISQTFVIGPKGEFEYAVRGKKVGDETIVKSGKSDAIRPKNKPNEISVRRAGGMQIFSVNGIEVARAKDPGLKGGLWGFTVKKKALLSVDHVRITAPRTWPGVYREIERQARAGSPSFMALAGRAYIKGYLLPYNLKKGITLIRKAVEANDPFGLLFMGKLYEKGRRFEWGDTIPKDSRKAKQCFEKARNGLLAKAEEGDAFAQFWLGAIYAEGQGVEKNWATAMDWYKKSHDNGNCSAGVELGFAYALGKRSLEKDEAMAAMIFEQGAEAKEPNSIHNLGIAYNNGLIGKEKIQKKAVTYFKAAADLNFSKAMKELAFAYSNGTGVAKDEKQAKKWFLEAAENGRAASANTVAIFYYSGRNGFEEDRTKARTWARRSILAGLDYYGSYHVLGHMLFKGEAPEKRKNQIRGAALYGIAMKYPNKYGNNQDSKTGLIFPMRVALADEGRSRAYVEQVLIPVPDVPHEMDALLEQMNEAFKARMPAIGSDLFVQAADQYAGLLFYENLWFQSAKGELPFELHSRLMEMLKPEMKNHPEFWFQYGQGAYEAGRPALALAAADRMKQVMESTGVQGTILNQGYHLLKAAALVDLGKVQDGYTLLYQAGIGSEEDENVKITLANYISNRLPGLLRDKAKLAFATGLDAGLFKGEYRQNPAQTYHHPVSGKLIPAGPAPVPEDNTPSTPDNDRPGPSKGPVKKEAETGKDDNALPKIRIID